MYTYIYICIYIYVCVCPHCVCILYIYIYIYTLYLGISCQPCGSSRSFWGSMTGVRWLGVIGPFYKEGVWIRRARFRHFAHLSLIPIFKKKRSDVKDHMSTKYSYHHSCHTRLGWDWGILGYCHIHIYIYIQLLYIYCKLYMTILI